MDPKSNANAKRLMRVTWTLKLSSLTIKKIKFRLLVFYVYHFLSPVASYDLQIVS